MQLISALVSHVMLCHNVGMVIFRSVVIATNNCVFHSQSRSQIQACQLLKMHQETEDSDVFLVFVFFEGGGPGRQDVLTRW